MSKQNYLRLACQVCAWRPPADMTMGVLRAHFEIEHPESVKEEKDGELDIRMDMIVVCPRCDRTLPLFASLDKGDHFEQHYHCNDCHRGYVINQAKDT